MIHGTGQPGSIAIPDFGTMAASGLTPEALMAYCQTRLNSLDDQVKQYFDAQKGANEARQALNDALQALNDHAGGITGVGGNGGDSVTCGNIEGALRTAIE